jgi:hypothetical protein
MPETGALPISPDHRLESPSISESGPLLSPIELAIVVPTFNERENVSMLVPALETALQPIQWELIFVDDNSPRSAYGDWQRPTAASESLNV